jgi:N-acetyl-gamma-glutamyl-phosphate reductase
VSYRVFIDGEAGTTGLMLRQRLAGHADIELMEIAPELRKDEAERAKYLNSADVVFLCLPDDASRQAVSLISEPGVRVIDSSTAFRCAGGWTYGFPELERGQREKIRVSLRTAVPGCYATGFIAAARPLIASGIVPPGCPLAVNAVSGYTGGGRKLIAKYTGEQRAAGDTLHSPQLYGLGLVHKHLPEMAKYSLLERPPVFVPSVGDFPQGMLVCLPLDSRMLKKAETPESLAAMYAQYYSGERFVKVMPAGGEGSLDGGFLAADACAGTNMLEIFVFGNEDRLLVVSRLDNLGKGASGAAVQCMNIMLGFPEAQGLE